MTWRLAVPGDLPTLAQWNHQLIRDEGHRNQMSVPELEARMAEWIRGDYRAVIFETAGSAVAYALFRRFPDYCYLRHFFVDRSHRRKGLGRACFRLLREEIWPKDIRLTVDVLCKNAAGIAFWRAVGYADYCLTLEIVPGSPPGEGPPSLG